MIIDLRSDTVTKPTKAMLDAMYAAPVGDDVFKEDPTVNALEVKVAKLFNKPKALFFPTGTMANQTAIKLHTNPGDQVICDKYAHIYNYEGGGLSFNSGVSCNLINGDRGMFTAMQAQKAINPPEFYHSPLTKLIAVENTTNKGGGACWDFNELIKLQTLAKANNLGFHLDGARLWNALIAKGETTQQYGNLFDTISVCLSKGLGCPIGSVLVGDEDIMKNAIRIRKILGAAMRQVGYLAAAGIYALDNNINRLSDDHQKAHDIVSVLKTQAFVAHIEPVETNIIIFALHKDIDEQKFITKLANKNIKISSMGAGKLRLVTHLDYTTDMHTEFISQIQKLDI